MTTDRQKRDASAFQKFAAFGAELRIAGASSVAQHLIEEPGVTDLIVRAVFAGTRSKVEELCREAVHRWRLLGWGVLLAPIEQPEGLDHHEHEATFYVAIDGRQP